MIDTNSLRLDVKYLQAQERSEFLNTVLQAADEIDANRKYLAIYDNELKIERALVDKQQKEIDALRARLKEYEGDEADKKECDRCGEKTDDYEHVNEQLIYCRECYEGMLADCSFELIANERDYYKKIAAKLEGATVVEVEVEKLIECPLNSYLECSITKSICSCSIKPTDCPLREGAFIVQLEKKEENNGN